MLKIKQVPACKMEPRSGYISWRKPPTHSDHMDFLFEYLTRYPQMECAVSPPWLLKHLRTLCGVPTLFWKHDKMIQNGLCVCGVPPPNSQTSYKLSWAQLLSLSVALPTPSWAFFLFFCGDDIRRASNLILERGRGQSTNIFFKTEDKWKY